MSELRAVFPDALDHVDAIVAENGAVLATRAGVRLLAAPVGRAVSAGLAARGVAHRSGQVLVACAAADEPAASEVIRELGLDCRLVRNRGELMILPAGVTKGAGLTEALDDMGLSRHNAIGVGDAENDHSLLDACEVGVAVANAVDAIRAHADVVLSLPDGQGVAELPGRAVLAWRQHPRQPVAFTVGARATAHLRHQHKYDQAGVEPAHRFHFRTEPGTPTGAVAANLADLEAELAGLRRGRPAPPLPRPRLLPLGSRRLPRRTTRRRSRRR